MKPNTNKTMTEDMRELTAEEMAEIHAAGGDGTATQDSITRKVDVSSPLLFTMACSGAPYKTVTP